MPTHIRMYMHQQKFRCAHYQLRVLNSNWFNNPFLTLIRQRQNRKWQNHKQNMKRPKSSNFNEFKSPRDSNPVIASNTNCKWEKIWIKSKHTVVAYGKRHCLTNPYSYSYVRMYVWMPIEYRVGVVRYSNNLSQPARVATPHLPVIHAHNDGWLHGECECDGDVHCWGMNVALNDPPSCLLLGENLCWISNVIAVVA